MVLVMLQEVLLALEAVVLVLVIQVLVVMVQLIQEEAVDLVEKHMALEVMEVQELLYFVCQQLIIQVLQAAHLQFHNQEQTQF